MKTLQEAFVDWLDFDVASFALAKCLGLMPDTPWDPALKPLFWTNNTFGVCLMGILEELMLMGALVKNEDQQFRWNPEFDYQKPAAQEDG